MSVIQTQQESAWGKQVRQLFSGVVECNLLGFEPCRRWVSHSYFMVLLWLRVVCVSRLSVHTSVFLVSSYLQSGVACCACLSWEAEVISRRRRWSSPRPLGRTWLPGNAVDPLPDESNPPRCNGTNGRKRREKDRVWLPDAQQKREDNMASLCELRPIKVINRLKRLTAVVSNVESLLIVIEVSDNSVVSFISV